MLHQVQSNSFYHFFFCHFGNNKLESVKTNIFHSVLGDCPILVLRKEKTLNWHVFKGYDKRVLKTCVLSLLLIWFEYFFYKRIYFNTRFSKYHHLIPVFHIFLCLVNYNGEIPRKERLFISVLLSLKWSFSSI